jgi:cyanophycinase
MIRERHQSGIPVAGCSAGALVALEHCVLAPNETDDSSVRVLDGLGLASGFVIGVHFTEQNRLPHVVRAMVHTQTETGWGLDEPTCAVFENGQFKGVLGQPVYEIEMTDFETKAYTIEKRSEGYRTQPLERYS